MVILDWHSTLLLETVLTVAASLSFSRHNCIFLGGSHLANSFSHALMKQNTDLAWKHMLRKKKLSMKVVTTTFFKYSIQDDSETL